MGLVNHPRSELGANTEGFGILIQVTYYVIETVSADGIGFIADSHFINVVHFPDSEFMFVVTSK